MLKRSASFLLRPLGDSTYRKRTPRRSLLPRWEAFVASYENRYSFEAIGFVESLLGFSAAC